MATLVQESVVRQPTGRTVAATRAAPEPIDTPTDLVLGTMMGILWTLGVFLVYAGIVLSFPFMPFLMPLLLGLPAALLLGMLILGFGAVIGWLGFARVA